MREAGHDVVHGGERAVDPGDQVSRDEAAANGRVFVHLPTPVARPPKALQPESDNDLQAVPAPYPGPTTRRPGDWVGRKSGVSATGHP